jgi:cell division protein FtsW
VSALAALYGMIGYAGFRAAKAARDRYAKLLAAGVTSLILAQAVLNFFAVMGLAPLTGVPLPFVSYGNTNLIVLLGAMGLVLGVAKRSGAASESRGLKSIEGGAGKDERSAQRTARADRGRRHGGPRRTGSRDSRRAARGGR